MDLDTEEITRQVYSIWELFGDIGGLLEIAVILVGVLMSLKIVLLGGGLD